MKRQSDLYGTIWKIVCRIPKGKVATYGGIARLCGFPRHARLVGYALHNLPHGVDVPWQRVINSQGKISLPRSNGQYQRQKLLLEHEGIVFVRDRVPLRVYAWSGKKVRSK
jgi:methylated-DNA-protein-cysteine methyltransferase related protein